MLLQRLLTAAIGIPLIALAVWVGGGLLAEVVALAVAVACIEIAAARGRPRSPTALLAAALAAALPLAALAGADYVLGVAIGSVLLLSIAFTLTFRGPAISGNPSSAPPAQD